MNHLGLENIFQNSLGHCRYFTVIVYDNYQCVIRTELHKKGKKKRSFEKAAY